MLRGMSTCCSLLLNLSRSQSELRSENGKQDYISHAIIGNCITNRRRILESHSPMGHVRLTAACVQQGHPCYHWNLCCRCFCRRCLACLCALEVVRHAALPTPVLPSCSVVRSCCFLSRAERAKVMSLTSVANGCTPLLAFSTHTVVP